MENYKNLIKAKNVKLGDYFNRQNNPTLFLSFTVKSIAIMDNGDIYLQGRNEDTNKFLGFITDKETILRIGKV